MSPKALIIGVSGQDGSLLARHLLRKNYEVWGTSRDAEANLFRNIDTLGVRPDVKLLSMVPENSQSVYRVVAQVRPTEIYYLAGQSSVGLSFEQPAETINSAVLGVLNVLEACRIRGDAIRLYNAGSSEAFGDTRGEPASETTPFAPRSPYAVGKASAQWLVANYREAYSLYACTGILFNHESPLRSERFVTQKIIAAAKAIAAGTLSTLSLGRLDIERDWGWAPEYVDAMWRMLQQDKPEDYVVATGRSATLGAFVEKAFSAYDLDWKHHVQVDTRLFRPTDIAVSRATPEKAAAQLGWRATYGMPDVVRFMVHGELGCSAQ